MASKNSTRFAVLFLILAAVSGFAQSAPCTSQRSFRVNNAWQPSQTIPYGYVLGIFNPPGSGCDLYITGLTLSAGSNVSYIEFGAAFSNSAMPGCTNNVEITALASPFAFTVLPGGVSSSGLPCGAYVSIGTVTDGRWAVFNGGHYDDDFGVKARKISPGGGYSIWTSPAGYPKVPSAVGDLAVTLNVVTVPAGTAPQW